jgi:hypothetical protein
LKINDTKVAKGIILSVMGNLPMVLDEFSQRDPESLKEWVEIFTGGRDKLRGAQGGGLVDLGMEWQTILIGGSNNSVCDTLRAAKNGDAMATRVVEFFVDLPTTVKHSKGDELKDALDANSGFAGDLLAKALVQPEWRNFMVDILPKLRQQFIDKYSFASEDRYKVRLLAAVTAISMLIKKLDLISFSIDRITEWAVSTIVAQTRSPTSVLEANAQILARFLAESLQGTLKVRSPWSPGRAEPPIIEPTRGLYVRVEETSGRVFIEEKALRRWLQKEQIPYSEFIFDLKDKGVIVNPRRLITLGAGTKWALGQVATIEVDGKHEVMSGIIPEALQAEKIVPFRPSKLGDCS